MDLTIRITGSGPILIHNERLANPLDPLKKQMNVLTSKKKRTDDDLAKICRIEFEAGLYMNSQGPYIPAWNIKKAFIEGGRINKLGKQVERAFDIPNSSPEIPLTYNGPRTLEDLWEAQFFDIRSVRVGQSKVPRCRPKFDPWGLEFQGTLDTSVMNLEEFGTIVHQTGQMVGLGTFRQRFGRFEATIK